MKMTSSAARRTGSLILISVQSDLFSVRLEKPGLSSEVVLMFKRTYKPYNCFTVWRAYIHPFARLLRAQGFSLDQRLCIISDVTSALTRFEEGSI